MSDRVESWSVPVPALLGLGLSAYLSILHWQGGVPPCGGYAGCAQVGNSIYSEIFGVPAAAVSALLYLAVLLLGLARIHFEHRWALATYSLYSLVVASTVFVAYLMAVELFVLRALSFWDLALTFITLVLLFLLVPEVWMRQTVSRATPGARRTTA